ncbi:MULTISPECIES: phage tail protein [Klebsiella pneumoniae complex]|uniref:phage tail protein n=1 Tax=Klebsiella pneumoniae complex TaxID=3390273 RepID=UPI0003BB03E8|nr:MULTISPECIES: phage tail protein [Klebsiella]QBA84991.1 tail fiber protein [Klebsiella phage ST405-OXA48phi1.1]HBX1747648.1 tail fiber protein [Klebsiella pneumoniae subsp. pneumoniae]AWA34389.1 phage tail protein [Klebsiella pneumoniae]ESB02732.1 phage Tail Collar domain protein [Klebsiella pneumoniae 909957]KSX60643.1 phage tail protein [Klebsiella pneumoniae]
MQSLMPPVDAPNNEFSDGNPSLGTLGTIVRALFLNNVQDAIRSVQRELLSILAAANINPDGDSNTQVLQAINKIMVDSNMSVPYGIPLPWPTSTPPTGYLICNGASFSAATYPNLAAVYTSGVLPDLRGQTIKGLPASGRTLLSLEADGNKSHSHTASATETDLGTKQTSTDGDHAHGGVPSRSNPWEIGGSQSTQFNPNVLGATDNAGSHFHTIYIGPHGHTITVNASGNSETTVKNMAFHYIVRAS